MTFTNRITQSCPPISRKEYVELEARDKAARDAYYALPRDVRAERSKPPSLVVMRRRSFVAVRTDANHAEWRSISDA